jgi:hypothetical protein
MLNITKVISTSFDDLQRRIIKVLRKGKSDVQTPMESAPFGIDSNPIKDMIAVYGQTEEKGKTVIIGYIDKNKLAASGETRLYSTDNNGNLKTYVWLKNDGTMEIGGNTKHMVRYEELNTALQNFKTLMQTELGKIQTGIIAGGGSYTPSSLTIDLSPAKIDNIKTS